MVSRSIHKQELARFCPRALESNQLHAGVYGRARRRTARYTVAVAAAVAVSVNLAVPVVRDPKAGVRELASFVSRVPP